MFEFNFLKLYYCVFRVKVCYVIKEDYSKKLVEVWVRMFWFILLLVIWCMDSEGKNVMSMKSNVMSMKKDFVFFFLCVIVWN